MAPLTRCVAGWRQRIELTDDATDDDDHDDGDGALLCEVAGETVIVGAFNSGAAFVFVDSTLPRSLARLFSTWAAT